MFRDMTGTLHWLESSIELAALNGRAERVPPSIEGFLRLSQRPLGVSILHSHSLQK